MKRNPNLDLARKIVTSFTINVKNNPEYLETEESWSQYCHRNHLVAQAMIAIDALKKWL